MPAKSDIEIIRRACAKRIMFVAGTADRRVDRDDAVPEENCWLRGRGWCLAYR